jgi:hypothetical protein
VGCLVGENFGGLGAYTLGVHSVGVHSVSPLAVGQVPGCARTAGAISFSDTSILHKYIQMHINMVEYFP